MTLNGTKAFAQKKWEPWLFYLVTALHLFPLFTLHFFPTVDGAAHVYNSRIIDGLLFNNPVYESIYAFNTVPEPNWLGHALLSLLGSIFPALVAEKILLGICLALLPVSFRKLALCFNPHAAFTTYLIFPFVYSFMFITGFYNFCLSLPLLLWAVLYWMRIKDTLHPKQVFMFSFLILLLYFCHLFAFGLICLIAGLILMPVIRTKGLMSFFKKSLLLLLMALPAVALTAYFLYVHHINEPGTYFESGILLKWLYGIQSIMTYAYEEPTIFAHVMFWTICLLLILGIVYRIKDGQGLAIGDLWLLISLVLLVMYFVFPDATAGGGFISLRLNYYFYLFLLLWICSIPLPQWLQVSSGSLAVMASLAFVISFYGQLREEDREAQELQSLAAYIEEGAVVMPLNYSTNWRHSHFSNYLAYEKDLILLENYEATSELFPVVWQNGYEPFDHLGDIVRKPPCADIENYIHNTQKQIDYIVQWKYLPSRDSCAIQVQQTLKANYREKFRSANGNAVLFERTR